jgi:hypothetical protein
VVCTHIVPVDVPVPKVVLMIMENRGIERLACALQGGYSAFDVVAGLKGCRNAADFSHHALPLCRALDLQNLQSSRKQALQRGPAEGVDVQGSYQALNIVGHT